MRNDWKLGVQRDEWSVTLRREPAWAQTVESAWERLCGLTGGWIGGHGLPEVFWRIPAGRPRWDRSDPDEPWLENSLAGRLHDLEHWMLSHTNRYGHDVVTIPIDGDTARKISPTFVAETNDGDDATVGAE